jgi:hypothetical protein
MGARRTILAGLATLGLTIAGAPVAQAGLTYGQVGSFGSGKIENPEGVAVDQASNDVYVASFVSPDRLDKFNASGSILTSPFGIGKDFQPGRPGFSGVAVDPLDGHLYAIDAAGQEVQTYDGATGTLLSHFSVEGSANIFGIATVVQIASDVAGSIYFPNAPNNEVQKFNPEGNVLQTFTGSGGEALKEPTGVAVAPSGDVYIADDGNGRVEEFTAAGAFVMAIGTGVDQTTGGSVCTAASGDTCGPGSDGSQSVALDEAGDVLVGENGGAGFHVVVYTPAGEKLADFGLGTIGPTEFVDTLAVGPTGLVYVTDSANNLIRIYAQQSKPSLLNESASAVRQTSATLNVTIGRGYADTTYHFEYGPSTTYGTNIPTPYADIGSGGLEGPPAVVGQELSGLAPGSTYHYRVVATNALGHTTGPDETFVTLPSQPPVVSTGQASGVAQNMATLTGTIDTEGYEAVYEFDLGVDTSYGTRIFGDAGVEPGAHTFTAALQGLMAGTTYHYRILATNAFGTTYGTDQAFTTSPYPSSTLTAPETPSLLATSLLAPAGGAPTSSAPARAAGAKSTVRSARYAKARRSSRVPSRRKRKGSMGSGGAGHAHNADREGGR